MTVGIGSVGLIVAALVVVVGTPGAPRAKPRPIWHDSCRSFGLFFLGATSAIWSPLLIMLTRRQLLVRGTTLLVLVPVVPAVLQACSSSPSDGPGNSCAGTASLSTVNEGHTHSVCVPTSDMASPPAAGAIYISSNDGSHTHTITLTAEQLSSIASGQSVAVTSTSDVDPKTKVAHTHDWTITKATGTTTTPPPSGW